MDHKNRRLADAVAHHGPVTEVRVVKTSFSLTLLHENMVLKTYHVAIGAGGFGDKVRQGDMKTPEGEFYVTEKLVLNADPFLGNRWMRLSYPNSEDAERGYHEGLITATERDLIINAINHRVTPPQHTALGGGIGVHGGAGNSAETQGNFWTHGCLGLSDADAAEVYNYVQMKVTRVVIER